MPAGDPYSHEVESQFCHANYRKLFYSWVQLLLENEFSGICNKPLFCAFIDMLFYAWFLQQLCTYLNNIYLQLLFSCRHFVAWIAPYVFFFFFFYNKAVNSPGGCQNGLLCCVKSIPTVTKLVWLWLRPFPDVSVPKPRPSSPREWWRGGA